MINKKNIIASTLISISLTACAEKPKDMLTAINAYVQPHGLEVDVYQQESGAPKPVVSFTQYKPRAGINSWSNLALNYVDAKDPSQCLKNYDYAYYKFSDTTKINVDGQTIYKYAETDTKLLNTVYFLFKDELCLFIEGNPQLDTELSTNKKVNYDKFNTDLLLIYQASVATKFNKTK
jgi:hypothetical protein